MTLKDEFSSNEDYANEMFYLLHCGSFVCAYVCSKHNPSFALLGSSAITEAAHSLDFFVIIEI